MDIKQAKDDMEKFLIKLDNPSPGGTTLQIPKTAITLAIKVLSRCEEEFMKEILPDALAESQVELIPNSAVYDVDVNKLSQAILSALIKEA